MKTMIEAWIVAGALAVTVMAVPAGAQSKAPSAVDDVVISGWALNMSNAATGANQTIRINIDGWSSPAQRQHLIATFLEKKQDGLVRELEKQPELGRFNFPGYMGPDPNNVMRLGTDIRYAMNFPGEDGGRRIVIITPRVIGFRETVNQPRTVDYPVHAVRDALRQVGQGRRQHGLCDAAQLRQGQERDRDRELLERACAAQQSGARSEEVGERIRGRAHPAPANSFQSCPGRSHSCFRPEAFMTFSRQILVGLTLGILTGLFFGEKASALKWAADGFVKLLQMMVLPYVTVSIIASLGSLQRSELRTLGLRAATVIGGLWLLALAFAFLDASNVSVGPERLVFQLEPGRAAARVQLHRPVHSVESIQLVGE